MIDDIKVTVHSCGSGGCTIKIWRAESSSSDLGWLSPTSLLPVIPFKCTKPNWCTTHPPTYNHRSHRTSLAGEQYKKEALLGTDVLHLSIAHILYRCHKTFWHRLSLLRNTPTPSKPPILQESRRVAHMYLSDSPQVCPCFPPKIRLTTVGRGIIRFHPNLHHLHAKRAKTRNTDQNTHAKSAEQQNGIFVCAEGESFTKSTTPEITANNQSPCRTRERKHNKLKNTKATTSQTKAFA